MTLRQNHICPTLLKALMNFFKNDEFHDKLCHGLKNYIHRHTPVKGNSVLLQSPRDPKLMDGNKTSCINRTRNREKSTQDGLKNSYWSVREKVGTKEVEKEFWQNISCNPSFSSAKTIWTRQVCPVSIKVLDHDYALSLMTFKNIALKNIFYY